VRYDFCGGVGRPGPRSITITFYNNVAQLPPPPHDATPRSRPNNPDLTSQSALRRSHASITITSLQNQRVWAEDSRTLPTPNKTNPNSNCGMPHQHTPVSNLFGQNSRTARLSNRFCPPKMFDSMRVSPTLTIIRTNFETKTRATGMLASHFA